MKILALVAMLSLTMLPIVGCAGPSEPTVDVLRIDVDPTGGVLWRGERGQFTAAVIGRDGAIASGVPVAWNSSDPLTVSVDGTGRVSALWPGLVDITVSAGGVSESVWVRVDLDGRWNVATVDGKTIPAVLSPNAACPPSATLANAPIVVSGGHVAFQDTRAIWSIDIGQDCGNQGSYGLVWHSEYTVDRSDIRFAHVPGPGPVTSASEGLLEEGRFSALLDHGDQWPTMRLTFTE